MQTSKPSLASYWGATLGALIPLVLLTLWILVGFHELVLGLIATILTVCFFAFSWLVQKSVGSSDPAVARSLIFLFVGPVMVGVMLLAEIAVNSSLGGARDLQLERGSLWFLVIILGVGASTIGGVIKRFRNHG